jgi:hypothetical protein
MSYRSVLMAAALLVLGACASIIHESNQNVVINSNPQGAKLVIDGRTFITPASVSLKGKPEYYFTLEKDGYKMANGKVDGNFRVWSSVVGNIFNLSGILGFAVDYWGTQSAFELQKDNIVTLEPLQPLPVALPEATTQPATTLTQPVPQPPAPLLQPLPLAPAGTTPAPAPTLR